jgi:diguanylate cyclase (GGDEF)-like protein
MHSLSEFEKDILSLNRQNWSYFFRNTDIPFLLCEMNSKLAPVRFIDANEVFCEKVQYTKIDLLKMKTEFLYEGEEGSFQSYLNSKTNDENTVRYRKYITSKLGARIPFQFNWFCYNVGNKKIGLAAVYDLTEEVKYEKKLQESEKLYRMNLDISTDAIIICSEKKVEYVNKAATSLFNFDCEKQVRDIPLNEIISEKYKDEFDFEVKRILSGEGGVQNIKLGLNKSHELYPFVQAFACKVHYSGKPCVQIVIRGIAKTNPKDDLVTYLAYYDHLTGLPNELLFNKKLNEAMELTKNSQDKLAVICIKLNKIGKINGSLGRSVGDEFIIKVSQRIADVFGKDMVYRIGSGEFHSFINYSEKQEINCLMRNLREALAIPYYMEGKELHCSFNAGISLLPSHSTDKDSLVKMADIAVNYSRDNEKSTFAFYNKTMRKQYSEAEELAERMSYGLANNEFLLYYQPQIDVETGGVIGAEALIRWNYKGQKLLTPNQFISIAEDTKQILNIGRWVLYNACRQIGICEKRGIKHIKISVNISPIQLQEKKFYDLVVNAIRDTGISPNLLVLEITETAIIDNFKKVNEVLCDLRKLGVNIALDDFGTGYSSLSYLKALNINNLKIDRAFIIDVTDCERNKAIVDSIIFMAHSLGISVTAEGIENKAQLEFLRDAKCDFCQGYLYSKPLPEKDFEKIIKGSYSIEPYPHKIVVGYEKTLDSLLC